MFPSRPFENIIEAKSWMEKFETWYNTEHLHSGINFVTPESKHNGIDVEILKRREEIYEIARQKNPNRWSKKIRNWSAVASVKLNPLKEKIKSSTKEKLQLVS